MSPASVAVIMGSQSDMDVMSKGVTFLEEQGIQVHVVVASAHRNPEKVRALAKFFEKEIDVVIAGAGMAAHLPGVIAALITKPVIGVPIDSSPLKGMDALLSIVQMPPGIPVATVAVNGARNAAILAIEILALKEKSIRKKLKVFRNSFKKTG